MAEIRGQNLIHTICSYDLSHNYTVADYRWFTVQLQLKTLLPYILLLTPAIEVIEITGKSLAKVLKNVISIVDYLYFKGQIL